MLTNAYKVLAKYWLNRYYPMSFSHIYMIIRFSFGPLAYLEPFTNSALLRLC